MTFSTVTTRRWFGDLHTRLNRKACRWVSRPHQASSPHRCLPVRFVQPIVVDDSFNRLKPSAISGEIATSSGTGACDMGTTGTGSDAVFAHAAPHSGSWPGILAFLPSAIRSAVKRRRCGTRTARGLAKSRRWLQGAAKVGSQKAAAVTVCRGDSRCDRSTHHDAGGQAVERASQLGNELREGRHTQGRKAVRVLERTGNSVRLEPSADHSDRFVHGPPLAPTDAPRSSSEPLGGPKQPWQNCVCGFITTLRVPERGDRSSDDQSAYVPHTPHRHIIQD